MKGKQAVIGARRARRTGRPPSDGCAARTGGAVGACGV